MSGFRMNSPQGKAILAMVRGGDHAHPGEEEALRLMAAMADRDQVRRVLDVGCGRGGSAAWFQREGWGEVVGLDIDAKSIDYAKSAYPGIDFRAQDIATLPRDAFEPFDLIYLLTAYYAIPDQREALHRLRGACRDGGTLLVVDYMRPEGQPIPPELGAEIGRPIVLEHLKNALADVGWGEILVDDWSGHFLRWYEALLDRFHVSEHRIVEAYGEDWYAYVTGWYGTLRDSLSGGRLGGVAVRAKAVH
ncbi:MAG: methyltransferase domain-containing protein [Methylotetracoccus sp.]